jgi:heparosan-N-sulfate-glucuronate 5-epimerase
MSAGRLQYYRRIFSAYLTSSGSQLTFWHDQPTANTNATADKLGEYYMLFAQKADYLGPFDADGIPMLDYRGDIGRQYNPIAVAQWGLGNHDLFIRNNEDGERELKLIKAARWLCDHLEKNKQGVFVWNHHFDWEYRSPLKAPWYSGLAQGQGISLLVRAHRVTAEPKFLDAAELAFQSFTTPIEDGGVTFTDGDGHRWFEEYIVSPPTHILNGFIWAAWGVYDYWLATKSVVAHELFEEAINTLRANLENYDLGFWSLYEQSGTRLPMIASAFYHRLHIVQLRIMHRLTGEQGFVQVADKWESYTESRLRRARAFCYKAVFKLCYY